MKKLYSLMLVIATVFVSCSQIDELLTENNGNAQVTFSLTADGVEQTRAGESLRYVMAPALPATSLAQSCYITMFKDCTSLTKAPELPATTLATSCYFEMFSGCAKLSEVTMLATNNITRVSIQDWLKDAGKEAYTRSLTLANSQSYNDVLSWLPDNWKQGATGTTVNFKN